MPKQHAGQQCRLAAATKPFPCLCGVQGCIGSFKAQHQLPPGAVPTGPAVRISSFMAVALHAVAVVAEYRREANRAANGGKERKDLYTDNWDGSEYKGSSFNVLTVIALVSVLTPLLGLVFAYTTFGVLWG